VDPRSQVKSFYEQVGWNRARSGVFVDAARAEDLRPVSHAYRTQCHLRVNRYLPDSGKFLLDVASGPVQYPEYLSYSESYTYRLCADITHKALCEARTVVGEKGLYVQCDITRLPFAPDSLDGIVSLHTIYHVPQEEQMLAFREIHRTLMPGGAAAVIYSWDRFSPLMGLFLFPYWLAVFALKMLRQFLRLLRGTGRSRGPQLYFRVHPYRWFKHNLSPLMDFETVVWRSVNVPFLKIYVHGRPGEKFLAWLYALEEKYPRFFGRLGAYPLFNIRK
jgi:ubiquinone/menaquinone biosynthesis C-methylase UbiE